MAMLRSANSWRLDAVDILGGIELKILEHLERAAGFCESKAQNDSCRSRLSNPGTPDCSLNVESSQLSWISIPESDIIGYKV